MRFTVPLLLVALAASPPAFACGGACGKPWDLIIPGVAAAGFGLFYAVTLTLERLR